MRRQHKMNDKPKANNRADMIRGDRNHQANMPEYNRLMHMAMKNNPDAGRMGGDQMRYQTMNDFAPDMDMMDERDNDFNRSLNYRPKANVDTSSNNKPLNTRSKVMKTNVKNVGMKDFLGE